MAEHKEQHKKSIRFFNNREVRAVWDEEQNYWWFSATDIVRAINNEPDYTKAGNYWRWLKRKLKQDGIEPVSATHGFKFEAPDGKLRVADVLNSEDVVLLAKNYPNNRANEFLDWFTYGDNTIDGQSKKKAYRLFESGILQTAEPGSIKCLQQIHAQKRSRSRLIPPNSIWRMASGKKENITKNYSIFPKDLLVLKDCVEVHLTMFKRFFSMNLN